MSQQVELSSHLSKDGAFALNVDSRYPRENLEKPDERFQIRSEADDQLIVHFTFNTKVRLSGIAIDGPKDEMRPTHIKLFNNKSSFGFEDVDSTPASFEADLEESDMGKMLALRKAKFNAIDSVTLFVESSEGGELVALSSVKFFGETVEGTNVSEIKKVGQE